jgi:hypothetical protein
VSNLVFVTLNLTNRNSTTTVFPDATDLPAAEPLKRSAKFLIPRAQWCADIDRPCRLATYSDAVIADACGQYLGDDAAAEAAVVTVTAMRVGAVETVTVCGPVVETPQYTPGPSVSHDYPQYTDEETPYSTEPTYEESTPTPVVYEESTPTPRVYEESTPTPAYTPAYVDGTYSTPSEVPTEDEPPLDADLGAPLAPPPRPTPSAIVDDPIAFPEDGEEDGVPADSGPDDSENPMDDDDLEMTPDTDTTADASTGDAEDQSLWAPSGDDGTDGVPDWAAPSSGDGTTM